MKITSAQAAKLLRQFNDELRNLEIRERNSKSFLASLGEDPDSVRPDYDYKEMQNLQIELEMKIRKLKHALNVFNATTVIPEFDMTIDEMLIYLPQLTNRCNKLSEMQNVLPKAREEGGYSRNSNIIDYRYANYDIEQVSKDYSEIFDKLSKAQTALDLINNTVEFEIEI
ncbi:MAG: hypothetical protein IJN05_04250 [Ruminococcus sp.]|jgi:hypothetical protein|nr:hypothetical protein [Ruminococcus sp.]